MTPSEPPSGPRAARSQLTQRLFPRGVPRLWCPTRTSGNDRVAKSQFNFEGVFLVRGAEGDYARWPKSAGGPYDGFLLSTANVFARELDALLRFLDEGRRDQAQVLADRVSRVVESCFACVHGFPTGNAFTNANKILDHLMAHSSYPEFKTPLRIGKKFIATPW